MSADEVTETEVVEYLSNCTPEQLDEVFEGLNEKKIENGETPLTREEFDVAVENITSQE